MKTSNGIVLVIVIIILALFAWWNTQIAHAEAGKVYLPLVTSSVAQPTPDPFEPTCRFYELNDQLHVRVDIKAFGDTINVYNEDNEYFTFNITGDYNLEMYGRTEYDSRFFFGFSSIINSQGKQTLHNQCSWYPAERNVGTDCLFPYEGSQMWIWRWGTTPLNDSFKIYSGNKEKLITLAFGNGLSEFNSTSGTHYEGYDEKDVKVCSIN